MCMPVHKTARGPPAPCHRERSCAPRIPAPGHGRRVLQPQRLQAAMRRAAIEQRLALQALQGGPELRRRGELACWRAGSAISRSENSQGFLHLNMEKSRIAGGNAVL